MWPYAKHTRLPCPSLSPGGCSNSCPLSKWCHPTISSFLAPFSSCPPSFPASGSFPGSWLFTSGGESVGDSAPVLPMNIQDWFPLGLTGLISLESKGLSRVKDCFLSNCYFLEIFWPRCMACRILVPKPGTEPMSPALTAQSLDHWTTREVSLAVIFNGVFWMDKFGWRMYLYPPKNI